MPNMRPMTPAYAQLSMMAGLFAGAADAALGRTYFASKIRADAWDLTPEKLDGWKREALALGVPAEAVKLSPAAEACVPTLMKIGMAKQKHLDAALKSDGQNI